MRSDAPRIMVTIDGSEGEGGGQMLRTSLALSLLTREPLRMIHIRARRPKPGLMRQHVTAVEAAAAVSNAVVRGAERGSTEIFFEPGKPRGGVHTFSIGTAGSTTLVLQTVLPALISATEPSSLVLEGGTHNYHAPPFDHLARALLPLLRRMGAKVDVVLDRRGFQPAGGGRFRVTIEPIVRLGRLDLLERGPIRARRARALVASLPTSIADRELAVLERRLGWDRACLRAETVTNAIGPGNVVIVEVESEHVTEVFTGFGQRGVAAERVAETVAQETLEYLAAEVPVGTHLADQLLLPMALAGGGSLRTTTPTLHTRTQAEVIRKFLGIATRFDELDADRWHIEVG